MTKKIFALALIFSLTVGRRVRCRQEAILTMPALFPSDNKAIFIITALLFVCVSGFTAAHAALDDGASPPLYLTVISHADSSPLPGTNIDTARFPSQVQTLSATDLGREGGSSLLTAVADQLGGVSFSGAMDDDFQPDIMYRGFAASPVLGTPQGLAVYQNGVRINEAFGDTVNWDLFPDFAIERVDLLGSNPVYGQNALGGAVGVTMKNGFTWQGLESEVAAGSFGRRSASVEYGAQGNLLSGYIAAKSLDEDGWRRFSPDSLRQLYADVGARGERGEAHLSFSAADNHLDGQGPAPLEELAADRSAVFTGPQENRNQLAFLTLDGFYWPSTAVKLQGNVYMRDFTQHVANGNTTDYVACLAHNGELCQSDGATPVLGSNGAALPDITDGGVVAIGENDMEYIHSVTWGGTAQLDYDRRLFGMQNIFAAGVSAERASTDFGSQAEVGVLDSSLQVEQGYFVDTDEDTEFTATPVSLRAVNDNYGIFASDTLNPTPELAVTISGRYNVAEIYLTDGNGTALNGASRYDRLNPAVGATYRIIPSLTGYIGYSEGTRTPTPSEIECSDPSRPCLLPSSLSSDPPTLKQVVSHTYETGLRGSFSLKRLAPGGFSWSAGVFRTDLDDDIYGVATSLSEGYFENIGSTRRQGVETRLDYKDGRVRVYADYSLVDATFRSAMALSSPDNPYADSNGNIHVQPGDRLPGIPLNQFKSGADFGVTPRLTMGATLVCMGAQFYRGDEANQNAELPGYQVVNIHASYKFSGMFTAFAGVDNIFNAHYYTFGEFGDPTGVGAPGVPDSGAGVDYRFASPAAPISASGGVRMKF